jgi:hypothetical protein
MGGYVVSAPACYGGTLVSKPDFPQKSYIGDISKGVAKHALAVKNAFKKIYS